jgi:hypothetical protein
VACNKKIYTKQLTSVVHCKVVLAKNVFLILCNERAQWLIRLLCFYRTAWICRNTCKILVVRCDANQIISIKVEDVSDTEEKENPVPLRYSRIKTERAVSLCLCVTDRQISQIYKITCCLSHLHLCLCVIWKDDVWVNGFWRGLCIMSRGFILLHITFWIPLPFCLKAVYTKQNMSNLKKITIMRKLRIDDF